MHAEEEEGAVAVLGDEAPREVPELLRGEQRDELLPGQKRRQRDPSRLRQEHRKRQRAADRGLLVEALLHHGQVLLDLGRVDAASFRVAHDEIKRT